MSEEMQGRVIAEAPSVDDNALTNKMLDDALTEIERITGENTALKAALTELMGTIMQLSNSLGPTLDAINNHYKVIMPLVQKPEVAEGGTL